MFRSFRCLLRKRFCGSVIRVLRSSIQGTQSWAASERAKSATTVDVAEGIETTASKFGAGVGATTRTDVCDGDIDEARRHGFPVVLRPLDPLPNPTEAITAQR